jgi:hypothetical protein
VAITRHSKLSCSARPTASTRIALAGGPHGLADITVIDADGSNPQSLTDTRDIAEIAWGP